MSCLFQDFDMSEACYNDEVCDVNLDIEEFSGGFRLRLDIPSIFFKYIIGKRGETKRRLETGTRTQIIIPRAGQEGKIGQLSEHKKVQTNTYFMLTRTHNMQIFREIPFIKPQNDT